METKTPKQIGSSLVDKMVTGVGKATIGLCLIAGAANLTSGDISQTGTYLSDDVTPNGKVSLFRPLGETDNMSNYSVSGGQDLEKGKIYTASGKTYFFGLTEGRKSFVQYNKQ